MRPRVRRPENVDAGLRLSRVRELNNLGTEQLAQELGVAQSTVQNWERGWRTISVRRAGQLARVLNVPVSTFLPIPSQNDIEQVSA